MPFLVRIRTPENMEIRFHQAGIASRGGAFIHDLLLQVIVGIVLLVVGGRLFESFFYSTGISSGFLPYAFLLPIHWLYNMSFELLNGGQTPGKKKLGIRVVTCSGRPIGFYHSLIRNVLRVVDFLPQGFLLGITTMLSTEKHQRLGDFLAQTMVIQVEPEPQGFDK